MLVFFLSSDGVNLFLQRNESLYFDYFRSWHSMQGESMEIPRIVFDGVVAQEIQKVINFTLSKFQETPEQVVLIAPGYERELQSFISERFALPVVPLELKERNVQPAWYVAFGAALRGQVDRTKDTAISLAPLRVIIRQTSGKRQTSAQIWMPMGPYLVSNTGISLPEAKQMSSVNTGGGPK